MIQPNTIILGDCLEKMREIEDKSIDLVLTDPPYGLGEKWTGGTWFTKNAYKDDNVGWDNRINQEAVSLAIKKGKHNIIFGGNYYVLPPSGCWLAWMKEDNMPTLGDFELAWTDFDSPNKRFRHRRSGWQREHPTQKPVALFEWILLNYSKENDLILDPFLGSGTTAIACLNTNRHYIGIEKEKRYFDIANERIKNNPIKLPL